MLLCNPPRSILLRRRNNNNNSISRANQPASEKVLTVDFGEAIKKERRRKKAARHIV